ncbi:MAG: hypothetical protein ACO1N5_09800 [Noviherbaspirillum sp.]
MEILLQSVLALLSFATAIYAHIQIPAFTDSPGKILAVRGILVLVGIGFGWVGASYVTGELSRIIAFLIGFGLVHLPAALILFMKGQRGEGRS